MYSLDEILDCTEKRTTTAIMLMGPDCLRNGITHWEKLLKRQDIFKLIDEVYPNATTEMAMTLGLDKIISDKITMMKKFIKSFVITEQNYINAILAGDIEIFQEVLKHYDPAPCSFHVIAAVYAGHTHILPHLGISINSIGNHNLIINALRVDKYNGNMIGLIVSKLVNMPYYMFRKIASNMKLHNQTKDIIKLIYTYIELEEKYPNLLFLKKLKIEQ